MKRRYLVDGAAALAALFSTTFCAADVVAAPPSHTKFSIRDNQVQPASANRFLSNANSRSALAANNSATNSSAAANTADAGDCDACDTCDDCAPGLWFAEAEALYWWRKSRPIPPLVTTNIGATPQAQAGRLSTGTTQVLFGQDNYTDGPQPGGRAMIGRWFDEDRCFGVAGSFFALGQDQSAYSRAASGTNDILALPFFNIGQVNPAEDALLINYPGVSSNGRVDVTAQNDVLGVDVYGRYLVWGEADFRLDLIGGYQFSRIDDSLRVHANYDDVAGIPNSNFDVTDTFDARNEFHGGTVGFLAQTYHGRWMVTAMGKVGLGNMRQTVNINGQTIATPVGGGAAAVSPQGLYALGTNIGSYSNDEFGIIPEGKINFGYQVNRNWTAGVGYSFMYWNDIITAGNTLDRSLNLTQIPGPLVGAARPDFAFGERRDFWAQGINFSLQFSY